jgi:AraC family transcriptional regulator of adaptative response/methylated-DNA-[protein]-cysteine methyltransferase
VVFYTQPEEAAQAGFRACKRCSPNTQAYEAQMVEQACQYIEAHLDERLTLDDLGNQTNLSPHHLQRVFKRAMGITPRQYIEARRLESLKARLRKGETVTNALYEAGYSSTSRLYERAPEQLGMTPAAYRKGGRGMQIHYTTVACSLGYVLVGATERGICAVSLGDSPSVLESTLKADYPAAAIERDGDDLGQWVAALLQHLEGKAPHIELPLDIQATAFQWRVWQELRRIPLGETRTYSQIAQAIGNPNAVRAVGTACGSNRVAVVIPCHRVIREDGSMGGYRWGLERKEELLRRERSEA